MGSRAPKRRSTKRAEVGRRRPLPRPLLEVAVGEHEAAGHRLQRVDGGVGVVDGLQPVRPVDGRGHARVERLDGREEVAGVDVLGAEDLPPLQVEEDEVLGQRPVGAVAAQRGLPHVPVRVDHPRHDDAARGVDLERASGRLQPGPDRGDLLADHEHVRVVEDVVGVVHGQHGAAAQHDGPAGLDRRGVAAHVVGSFLGSRPPFQRGPARVKRVGGRAATAYGTSAYVTRTVAVISRSPGRIGVVSSRATPPPDTLAAAGLGRCRPPAPPPGAGRAGRRHPPHAAGRRRAPPAPRASRPRSGPRSRSPGRYVAAGRGDGVEELAEAGDLPGPRRERAPGAVADARAARRAGAHAHACDGGVLGADRVAADAAAARARRMRSTRRRTMRRAPVRVGDVWRTVTAKRASSGASRHEAAARDRDRRRRGNLRLGAAGARQEHDREHEEAGASH